MSLELRNVVKRVGAQTHIYETSIQLAEKGFNILLGSTLAGKTTLMQLMAGLDRPTMGTVWFGGKDVTAVPVRRRNVSMVYQQFINYPNLTVFENIASPLRVARMKRSVIGDRVQRIAELLRLTPMLHRRPAELSGGQQQRTVLARALAKDAYRRPADLLTAQVFSNPPINTAPVVKDGDKIALSDSVWWTAKAGMQQLPNGRYTLGVRSHCVSPVLSGSAAVEIEGRVQITELTS